MFTIGLHEGVARSCRKSLPRLSVRSPIRQLTIMTKCVRSAIINVDQLQRFTIEVDKPAPAKPVMANRDPAPVSRREFQYNMIGEGTLT